MRHIAASALAATVMFMVPVSASAQRQSPYQRFFQDDFERSASGKWVGTGTTGFDWGELAYAGFGNAWIRGTDGWNALTSKAAGSIDIDGYFLRCRAEAWIRASSNVSNVYMSAIDTVTGQIYWEFGPTNGAALSSNKDKGYKLVSKTFSIDPKKFPAGHYPELRIGMWGNGQDAWLQFDNAYLSCTAIGNEFPASKASELRPARPGDIVPCDGTSCGLDL